jgi:hypothetical protein
MSAGLGESFIPAAALAQSSEIFLVFLSTSSAGTTFTSTPTLHF